MASKTSMIFNFFSTVAKLPQVIHTLFDQARHKGFFDLLFANFLVQFLGFGTQLIVASFLLPSEIGQIKIIQSYIMPFLAIGTFGFNTAVLKLCSENRPYEEREGILKCAILRSLLTTIISMCTLVILSHFKVITSSRHLSQWLIIYSVSIPFNVLTSILMSYLQALKKIKQMARMQIFIKLQSIAVVIFSTWKWGFHGFIVATIIAYFIGFIPLLFQTKFSFLKTTLISVPKSFANISLFSMLATLTSIIGQYIDIYMMDHFLKDREQIGFYSIATIFIAGASQITGTVQTIITPHLSAGSTSERWFKVQLLKNQLQLFILSVVVAPCVYLFAFGVINVFFDPTYRITLTYLAILLIRYVIWSSIAVLGVAVLALGQNHYNFIAQAIYIAFNILFTYYFMNNFGIIGIAWAQVVSYLVIFIFSIVITCKVLKKAFPQEPS